MLLLGLINIAWKKKDNIETREIDNTAVREAQIDRLNLIKRTRNLDNCQKALEDLEKSAASGDGNLLSYAIEAARHRATLGEISYTMEKAFTRHSATTRVISGVYENAYAGDPEYSNLQKRIEQMERRPHVFVAKVGQDGHDRGAKVIATAFSDLGFTVDLSEMFETPEEIAKKAIKLGVDVVGISSLAAGHKTLIPEIIEHLKTQGRLDIIVIAGGVIPEKDYEFLRNAGVSEVFGPGTNVIDAANSVLSQVKGLRRNV
jgi:methylmalonyl-CoA mutase